MTQIYLSTKELAERWRLKAETLSNWRVMNTGPAYTKLGSGKSAKVLYRLEDVEQYEQQHRQL